MLFSKNGLSLQHSSLGFGIRFDPIEALKTVNPTEGIHVSMSKEWLEARSKHADINKIAKPYDWTFTPTNYKGSILNENPNSTLIASPTEEKIDYERLKVQETIVFFDEIILYEDELDDNGISKLSLKIVGCQLQSNSTYFYVRDSIYTSFFYFSESHAFRSVYPSEIFLTC